MKKRIPNNLLKSIEYDFRSAGEDLVQEGCVLYDKGGVITLDFSGGQLFEAAVADDDHLYNVFVEIDKSHRTYHWDCDC